MGDRANYLQRFIENAAFLGQAKWRLALLGAVFTISGSALCFGEDGVDLVPDCGGVFDLCGYKQIGKSEAIIPRRFERAMPFSDGLAGVRVKGQFGYANSRGEVVVEPQYDLAGPFTNGIAEVVVDGKAGVIDKKGNFILDPHFARAVPLTSHVVIVQTGNFQASQAYQSQRLNSFQKSFDLRGGVAGLYDLGTGWKTDEVYEFRPFTSNGELVWARDTRRSKSRYGLLTADGKWVVQPTYEVVFPVTDGLASVARNVAPSGGSVVRWGALDSSGKLVVPLKYDWLSSWRNGYAIAKSGQKQGFVDRQGRLLGGRLFEQVEVNLEGKPWKVKAGGQWLGIDEAGNLGPVREEVTVLDTLEPRRVEVHSVARRSVECNGGASIFREGSRWGIKGPDNGILVEAKYDAISCFDKGVAWVPNPERRAWCPLGVDGHPQNEPDCIEAYYPVRISHYRPEKLDTDPFESSVLWNQAFLAHGVDASVAAPRLVPGVGYATGNAIIAACKDVMGCN